MEKRGTVKRALLIGIRTYPFIPADFGRPLNGCHNDVELMRERLLARGFEDLRVLVDSRPLVGEEPLESAMKAAALGVLAKCPCAFCAGDLAHGLPTRGAIRDAVERLALDCAKQDVAAIFYSGHGSQFSSRSQFAGHLFQTLVPFDSGRGQDADGRNLNRDILDWEVELWTRRLNESTDHLTLVFDCCHSGGVADTRRGGESTKVARGRQVRPGDGRFEAMLAKRGDEKKLDGKVERRPSGWLRSVGDLEAPGEAPVPGGGARSAVVLAACGTRELASETVDAAGKSHGLFTLQLAAALASANGGRWTEIFPAVAAAVTGGVSTQHPRREGDGPIFAAGAIDDEDVSGEHVVKKMKKHAVIIGIDSYDTSRRSGSKQPVQRPFPRLETAKADAEAVKKALERHQGYDRVETLFDDDATKDNIRQVIELVASETADGKDHALLIYFAGHGEIDRRQERFAGCLVPWDAGRDDEDAWLKMSDLRDLLVGGERYRLMARHVLLILDCCFAGAFMLDRFRGDRLPRRPIYYSEYRRFVEGQAWQLLTSSSHSQQARDSGPGDEGHSPFAKALIDGLSTGGADSTRRGGRADNIVTARELHRFIDQRLVENGVRGQTPGLTALLPTNTGEFIFAAPPFMLTPEPDPPLAAAANPWIGAPAYASTRESVGADGAIRQESPLFFGRRYETMRLLHHVLHDSRQLVVVQGPSGCGKTSLVRAGLMPLVENLVDGRDRMRDWIDEVGPEAALISAEDLEWVRDEWVPGLAACLYAPEDGASSSKRVEVPALLRDPVLLAERVRQWAEKEDLLDARKLSKLTPGEEYFARLGLDPGQEAIRRAHRLGIARHLEDPQKLQWRLTLWAGGVPGLPDVLVAKEASLIDSNFEREVLEVDTEQLAAGLDLEPSKDGTRRLIFVDRLESLRALTERDRKALHELHRLRSIPGVKLVAALRDAAASRILNAFFEIGAPGVTPEDAVSVFELQRPDRAALAEIVEEPAAARTLAWESRRLVQRIASSHEALPAPLPALSLLLREIFDSARRSRGGQFDEERELKEESLDAVLSMGRSTLVDLRLIELESELAREERRMLRLLAPRFVAGFRAPERAGGVAARPWTRGQKPRRESWAAVARAVPAAELRVSSKDPRGRDVEADDLAAVERVVERLVNARVLVESKNQVALADDLLVDLWWSFLVLAIPPELPVGPSEPGRPGPGKGKPFWYLGPPTDVDLRPELAEEPPEVAVESRARARESVEPPLTPPRIRVQEIRRAAEDWMRAREAAEASPSADAGDPANVRSFLWDRHPDLPAALRQLADDQLALTRLEHDFIRASNRWRRARLARDLGTEAARLATIDWPLAALLAVQATELAPAVTAAAQALHEVVAATPLSVPLGHFAQDAELIRGAPGALSALRFGSDGQALEIGVRRPDRNVWVSRFDTLDCGFRWTPRGVKSFEGDEGLTLLDEGHGGVLLEGAGAARVKPAIMSPDTGLSAWGARTGAAVLLSSPRGEVTSLHGHGQPANYQCFSADGRWLASGAATDFDAPSSEVRLWRLGVDPVRSLAREPRRLINAPRADLVVAEENASSSTRDGAEELSAYDRGGLEWHAVTNDWILVATRRDSRSCYWGLLAVESGFEPDRDQERSLGRSALAPGPDGPRLWVVRGDRGERRLVDRMARSPAIALRESPEGTDVEGVSADDRIVVLSNRRPAVAAEARKSPPESVSGRRAWVYVAGDDDFVKTELEPPADFHGLSRVAVSSGGALLASQPVGWNREFDVPSYGMPRIWRTTELSQPLDAGDRVLWEKLETDSDNKDPQRGLGMAAGDDRVPWEKVKTETEIKAPELGRAIRTLTFSPDSRWLAGLTRPHEPLLWRIDDRAVERRRVADLFGATALAFSPVDGSLTIGTRWLGIGTRWGETWMFDLRDPEAAAQKLEHAHGTAVSALAFDPGGDRLAVASGREVHLWDTLSMLGRDDYEPLVLHLGWSEGSTVQVSFSPDGKILAAHGAVGPPSTASGETLEWPAAQQRLAAFRLDVEELRQLAWANADRSLTEEEWRRYIPDDPYAPYVPEDPDAARRLHKGVAMGLTE